MPDQPIDILMQKQLKLHEHAHGAPLELKPLGFALRRQGIRADRLYCNPEFLGLPLEHPAFARQVGPEQLSALTASFFARVYGEIAGSELIATHFNTVAAEGVFERYSDSYMVLFNETAEEYDHIATFRTVCKLVHQDSQAIDSARYTHLAAAHSTFGALRERLCPHGFGAAFLLLRYLLNLALKQLEGFMMLGEARLPVDDIALDIVRGHSADEARHLTTSLQLGLALLRAAQEESRSLVIRSLKGALTSMISTRFGPRASLLHAKLSHDAFALALQGEAFSGCDAEALRRAVRSDMQEVPFSPEYQQSQRWVARQLRSLSEELEVRPAGSQKTLERFHECAA